MTAKRLGRGLSALIRETTDETAGPDSVLYIPLELISPNPFQPRQDFDSPQAKKSLEELGHSIQERGIIQPVTVRAKDGRYQLIIGERRWRAAQAIGLTEIPAHVLDVQGDAEMMEYALIENLQRENLNVVDEAEAYASLSGKFGMSHGDIAKAVGKNRVTVSNTLRLLKLPPEIIQSLRKEEITAGHARALLRLKSRADMLKLWKRIVQREESVRTTEELVAQTVVAPGERRRKKRRIGVQKSADLRKVENDLIAILGTKVTIRPRAKGGTIEVDYYSDEDLQRLVEMFSEIES
ncbi:MAG: ParB/RepB/Spo0J family partition protein [Fidelibacterota bacterium]